MNIEVFSHSKYKGTAKPGDDVLLVIPDRVLAVFDGATDPTGRLYGKESSGRFAARIAARTVAQLDTAGELATLEAASIFQAISDAVRAEAGRMQASHPPSTTAAVVVDTGSHYRLLIAGDSGIRINGETVYQHHKLIDTVSTAARIAVFNILAAREGQGDETEMKTRQVIFAGLAKAEADGVLSAREAQEIVLAAGIAAGLADEQSIAGEFLTGGIRTQQGYANRAGHRLGYASLNGGTVIADGTRDMLIPKDEVSGIELFTDGYLTLPGGTRVADWEAEFARIEDADFHKISRYPAVKGSTSVEFCDDRSVITATIS